MEYPQFLMSLLVFHLRKLEILGESGIGEALFEVKFTNVAHEIAVLISPTILSYLWMEYILILILINKF